MENKQSACLHQMMAEKSKRAKILAITSGKGGVGKTNITANLSICLAASNKKVTVLDADLGLGNLDVVMNINSKYNLWHVVTGQKSLEEVIHVGPGDVEVICGGSGFEELANLNHFQQQRLISELDSLVNTNDVVLIDTGAGIGKTTIGFCLASDHTLVVTTPEPTAMTDAYAMIKVLRSHNYEGQISVAVNMANSASEGKKVYRQIADVARRFLSVDVYEAGVLCRDDKLATSVRMREPVVLGFPRARITSSLVAMAARLSKGTAVRSRQEGFFHKVVNWFS